MKQLLIITLLIVACFFCADGYCGIERAEDPVLFATGDDFAIHVFKGAVQGDMWIYRIVRPGIVILHTALTTGEATWLIHTGTFEVPTRRISFSMSRLIGLLETETHIAAALYNAERIWDRLPNEPPPEQGTYSLSVFEKKHGKKSFEIELDLSAGGQRLSPMKPLLSALLRSKRMGFSSSAIHSLFTLMAV